MGERPTSNVSSASPNMSSLQPTVACVETHTVGPSLFEYLRMKVHPDIQTRTWSQVMIEGSHQRHPSLARISSIEKRDKPFNWMRLTTSKSGCSKLQVHCFPGVDYVEHFAAIVATYLSLNNQSPDIVKHTLPSPEDCLRPLLDSNIAQMGPVDIVVIGYVHGLEEWTSRGPWISDSSEDLFAWKKLTSKLGYRIAFLGCRVGFWGDIAGNLVRALQTLHEVKCILYIGKLGSLRAEHIPNRWLATGCQSLVDEKMVTWVNPLEPLLSERSPDIIAHGVHYTLGSVLDETKKWLLETKKSYDFVDPEIGHLAKAANEGGTEFGYLHIISDNLAQKYIHDLSNERLTDVLEDRKCIIVEIQDILGRFFDQWSPKWDITGVDYAPSP